MRLRLTIAAALLAVLATDAAAIDASEPFDDPQKQARYEALIREVRCLVCQNESIADSNAPLAADLRREVRSQMRAGADDAEILEFLIERYGDFVVYRPPLRPRTLLLWAAPLLLLVIGGFIFVRVLRARAGGRLDDELPAEARAEDGMLEPGPPDPVGPARERRPQ